MVPATDIVARVRAVVSDKQGRLTWEMVNELIGEIERLRALFKEGHIQETRRQLRGTR